MNKNQNTNKKIIINNRNHSHTKNNSINPVNPHILLNIKSKIPNMSKITKMNIKKMVIKRIKNKRNQNTNKPNIISKIMLSLKEILIYLPLIN